MRNTFLFWATCLLQCVSSTPTRYHAARAAAAAAEATVKISYATVVGNVKNNVESFGGIPYAEPPVGKLRLKPPQKLQKQLGVVDATGPAGACPQMLFNTDSGDLTAVIAKLAGTPFVQKASGQSEDCLTITVARPQGTKADAKLPVLFWIFGGAFELGWSSMYDGTNFINTGIDTKMPFVFVAINYRIGGFGFLGGKEILKDGSANLGLLDQRMGLEWVADHIADFGGDPEKVTLWGESAGAMSIVDHLVMYGGNNSYKGKPLFRGAIMNSGNSLPAGPVDSPRAQGIYDKVVKTAGCSGAADTLKCLRDLDYNTFLNAANSVPFCLSYDGIALSYLPRPDGVILPASADILISQGKYAAVPMISGNMEDEGTLFSLFQTNVSTTEDLVEYFQKVFFHDATAEQIRGLVDTYPASFTAGSPFRTGVFNEIRPGFKRIAAILGDMIFTLSRRAFLELTNKNHPEVPSWSYLSSYNYGTPILGSFHGGDILQVFYGLWPNYAARSTQHYYLSFLHTLDPNGVKGNYPEWPRWSESKTMLQFFATRIGTIVDDFRKASYEKILENVDVLRI